ncbi:hypothetical protein DFH01_00225 [Falsiroseomonas bella]|uniref:Uncharacterized protein n=1 Tax=Falsiroseomonas bella TaxID=2184016 RepID=A0A317FGS1_9PROT|nr:hypothetical protein DFH01_00225 [Falsiroseomonas bella]
MCWRPDVDWETARREYECGLSLTAIGRRHKISREAVRKRVRKEGWERTPDADALALTDTARRLSQPATGTDHRMVNGGGGSKRSMTNAQRLLDMLACGATVTLAAKRLGMAPLSVRRWLEQDEQLAAMVEQAQAEFASGLVDNIRDAGKRDWRASFALLEKMPVSRDEFGEQPNIGGPGEISIAVVLPGELQAMLSTPWQKPEHPPAIEHDPAGDAPAFAKHEGDDRT